jgi:hypothetical protein
VNGHAVINLGNGSNNLTVDTGAEILGNLTYVGGSGNDIVVFSDAIVWGNMSLVLASGDVAGNSATFNVVANGTAPLSYQWRKGAVNIGGATSSGVELELNARVHSSVDVFGGVGYTRARFSDDAVSNGVPVGGTTVRIYDLELPTTTTDPLGRFQFENVPAGLGTLTISARFQSGDITFTAILRVVPVNGGVTSVDSLVLRPFELGSRSRFGLRFAAGSGHTVALRENGTLWGWGDNLNGQLGSGTFDFTNAPQWIGTNVD